MVSSLAIGAIILRNARMWRRDFNLLFGTLYWPLLDVIIWGYLGSWIGRSAGSGFEKYETIALLGILLWQIVGRGCNIMAYTFIEELVSNNVVNLFSLPLRMSEWVIGILTFTAGVAVLTSCVGMLFIKLLYTVSFNEIIIVWLFSFIPLFLSSIWLGFTCLQIIVLLGKRGAELGFIFGWFLLPFSGAYYPIEVLPVWGQKMSAYLPMTPVFKAMRAYVQYQHNPVPLLLKGCLLGFVYASVAIFLFVLCFNWSKRTGLARLAD